MHKVNLSLMFPLLTYEVPVTKDFSNKIKKIKLKKDKDVNTSFFKKNQSNSLCADVENHLKESINSFAQYINKEVEMISVWVQKYNKYQYHDMHVHTPMSDFSFVYYVDCTKNSGKTIFFNPGHPYITTHKIKVRPQKNRLIIFSSTLPHYAEPNKDNKRLVVSGNLTIKNKSL